MPIDLWFLLQIDPYQRYPLCPTESHYAIGKQTLKYLKGMKDVGLWYSNNVSINLVGYYDSDFVGCMLDMKSTSGMCHLFGSSLTPRHNEK